MQIPSENGGRGHNFYVWQLSEATVLMLRQIFKYGRKRGWIEHQNQLSFIRSIENWKRYECKCRSCSLVLFVWNVHMMLLQWKLWCFIKKIFKVSSTFKKDRQLTGGTQCNTVPNRKFRIGRVGPQTKILKAWVEENKIFRSKKSVSLKFFKFEYLSHMLSHK